MKNIFLSLTVCALFGCGEPEEEKNRPIIKRYTQTSAILLLNKSRSDQKKDFCLSVKELSNSKFDFQTHYPQEWIFDGINAFACELIVRTGMSSPLCISGGTLLNPRNVSGLQGFAIEYDLEYEFVGKQVRTYVDIADSWATIGHGDNKIRKLVAVSSTEIQNLKTAMENCRFP